MKAVFKVGNFHHVRLKTNFSKKRGFYVAEAQEIEPRIIISMFQNFKKKVYQANKNCVTTSLL